MVKEEKNEDDEEIKKDDWLLNRIEDNWGMKYINNYFTGNKKNFRQKNN